MNSKKSAEIQGAFRSVRNFCADYSVSDINEMLTVYYIQLSKQSNAASETGRPEVQERMLDFLEGLEELLPAVYVIEQLRSDEISLSASN